jgi:hypothetical protein
MRCGTEILKDIARYEVTCGFDAVNACWFARNSASNHIYRRVIFNGCFDAMIACIEESITLAKKLEQDQ